MGEWITHNLGELIEVQNGYAFKSTDFDDFHGIPVIKIKNIASGELRMDDIKFYPHAIEGLERFVIYKNDILIALTGSHVYQPSSIVGKVARYTNDGISLLNQRVGKIYSLNEKKTNEDYIYWFFKQWEVTLELALNAGGSANQANISGKLIKTLELELPPLPEQKAIASVLSSLDDKIDLLHRQNKTLEAMAETLFRQWFVEETQDDWEEKKLGELLDITSSKRIFYKEYVSFGVPFYRSKEIIELHNTGITNSELYISENRYDEIAEKFGVPVEGDILLTSVGTLGVPYRVKKNDKFYFKDGNLTWFKNFKGIPGILIYFWLKSNIGKEQLDAITIGSTQPALTIIGLKKVRLIIPPPDKLKEIEGYLGYIYNKIDSNHSQIRTLGKLRDMLLPKLMSGEVRVKI